MGQIAAKQVRVANGSFTGILAATADGQSAFAALDKHASAHHKAGADQITAESLYTAATNTNYVMKVSAANTLTMAQLSHGNLSSVSANDHHSQLHASSHSLGGSDVVTVENLRSAQTNTNYVLRPSGANAVAFSQLAHSNLSGVGANDHHAQLHTIASHSDTTATGAELETLTNTSNADALHSHSHSNLTSVSANQHHNQLHASTHHKGGGDQMTVESMYTAATNTNYVLKVTAANTVGMAQLAHSNLSGVGANDHHAQLHTIASHSDTTATGAELETLTNTSNADALHSHSHSNLTGVSANQHHNQLHASTHHKGGGDQMTVESMYTAATNTNYVVKVTAANTLGMAQLAHSNLSGVGANDHHAQLHTIASHSDTTATGAELETLTNTSNADSLHSHSHSNLTSVSANQHHNQLHSASHSENQSDEIFVENLGAVSAVTTYVLKPSGSGGCVFGPVPDHQDRHRTTGSDTIQVDYLGAVSTDTNLRLAPNGSGGVQWSASGGSSLWTQNGSDIYYTTGDVGVGVTSPVSRFDVQESVDLGRDMGRFYNTSTHSNAYCSLNIQVASTINDPFLQFICPGRTWAVGVDNSDSDRFKIQSVAGPMSNLSTVMLFYMATNGDSHFLGSSHLFGYPDSVNATLHVYGNDTTQGGRLNIFNGASEDSTIDYYGFEASGPDGLEIKETTTTRARLSTLKNLEVQGYHTKLGSRLVWKITEDLRATASVRGGYQYDSGIDWTHPNDSNLIYQYSFEPQAYNFEWRGSMASPYGLDWFAHDILFYANYRRMSMGDQGVAYALTWPDQAAASIAANAYYKRTFRVWDMGTPDYNSGWTAVAANTNYLFAHGLGTNIQTALLFVEYCSGPNGINGYRCCMNTPMWSGTSYEYASAPVRLSSTNVYVRTGPSYCFTTYSTGGTPVYLNTGYVRVRAWNITPDYDQGAWGSLGINVPKYIVHNLGTRDIYLQMQTTGSSGGPLTSPSATWNYGTLYGYDLSHGEGPKLLCLTEEKLVFRYWTVYGRYRSSTGVATAPTTGGYTRTQCYL